jgi:hypothetical protein
MQHNLYEQMGVLFYASGARTTQVTDRLKVKRSSLLAAASFLLLEKAVSQGEFFSLAEVILLLVIRLLHLVTTNCASDNFNFPVCATQVYAR